MKINKLPKSIIFISSALILGVIVLALLELTDTTHLLHKKNVQTFDQTPTSGGAGSNINKGEPANKNETSNSSNSSSSTQPGDNKNSVGTSNNVSLLTPSGDFVSNHHPNLSGSPAPNLMSSVCTTTPGATCTIIFTKDGVQKSLPAQTTDRGGSAYWNWRLQDIGITSGSWKITAKATLNDQTKTADDALNLEVAQ